MFVDSIGGLSDLLFIDFEVAVVVYLFVVGLVIYCCMVVVFICLLLRTCLTCGVCLFGLWFVVV